MNSLPYPVKLWFPTRRVETATHHLKDGLRQTRMARAIEVSLRWVSKRRSLRRSFSNATACENSPQSQRIRREDMPRRILLPAVSSISRATVAIPAVAADVTPQRLMNAASEPQNWLMIHHDYDNSRHSSLKEINRDTITNLQLKYTFSIGGRSTGGTMRGKEESTPLVDDGYMYVTDTWSRVLKFDVRGGTEAIPLWRYDPKIRVSRTTRGLAMYGNNIFLSTYDARLIALNRDSGEVVWEVQAAAPMDPKTGTPSKTQAFSGAPLTIKTAGGRELVVQGESTGGSLGTRSWVGAFEADTGKLV